MGVDLEIAVITTVAFSLIPLFVTTTYGKVLRANPANSSNICGFSLSSSLLCVICELMTPFVFLF